MANYNDLSVTEWAKQASDVVAANLTRAGEYVVWHKHHGGKSSPAKEFGSLSVAEMAAVAWLQDVGAGYVFVGRRFLGGFSTIAQFDLRDGEVFATRKLEVTYKPEDLL